MRALALLILLGTACSPVPETAGSEPLYFALEVRQEGRVIAKPKLLGASGRSLRAERRAPGESRADYVLRLYPSGLGEGYQVDLELAVPGTTGRAQLAMLHAQERRMELGARPGQLQVSLMVMRVDSPEFRALMNLEKAEPPEVPAVAI